MNDKQKKIKKERSAAWAMMNWGIVQDKIESAIGINPDQISIEEALESIEKEYSVSNDMIVANSKIDSIGKFAVKLNNLPSEWCLLRLHVVKKGVSPASLVIGSLDENYCFIIANRYSNIELHNTIGKPIFKNVAFSETPYMSTFEYIKKLSNYANSINYENSLIEKEFINIELI